jgi:phospholipid-binding lipoprotein MlaA
MSGRPSRYLLAGLLVGLLTACSSQPVTLSDPERDPWEGFNRKTHAFNSNVDRYFFKPVARGYDTVMPDAPQRGVRNFFRNLGEVTTFLNQLLQGKFEGSMDTAARFLVNSTVGLAGFFDVATRAGIPRYDEDFGQTMAVWGWEDSRYLVIPFLGPRTVRDFAGRSFYGYFHPVSYMIREHDAYYLFVIDLITLRAELLAFDEQLVGAADPYVMVRDVYLQNREFKIYDGEPPAPDYDALLEEY